MRVASWNINGLAARAQRLDAWLKLRQPDVVALQETRNSLGRAGLGVFSNNGYFVVQTQHVALATLEPLTEVADLMGDGRALAADTQAGRVLAVYVPNGQKAGTLRHELKLKWLTEFVSVVKLQIDTHPDLIIGADMNVARADLDVWAPERYRKRNLFTHGERQAMAELLDVGLIDVFRVMHGESAGLYSWWNYAHDSFNRNRGWRLDYILTTANLASLAEHAIVDVVERGGERTSDHAPLWIDLAVDR